MDFNKIPFDPEHGKFGGWPFISKPQVAMSGPPPTPKPFEYIRPPAVPYDVTLYAQDRPTPLDPATQAPMKTYVIGTSKGATRPKGAFPPGYQMDGANVAACLHRFGRFEGDDLVHMVGIWYREAGWYCHQIVWRPETGDYSFGGGGFNMKGDMGSERRVSVSKELTKLGATEPLLARFMGRSMKNADLLDPAVNAVACRWLFNVGLKSSKRDGLHHWGGYKKNGTGLDNVDLVLAQKAVDEAFPTATAPAKTPALNHVKYFQGVCNVLSIRDERGQPLDVDGKYGRHSENACINAHLLFGLAPTGVVDDRLWAYIDRAVLRIFVNTL